MGLPRPAPLHADPRARATTLIADEPWAERIPATLAAAVSVVVLGMITRRLGGGRGAQSLAAYGYAFATVPLMLGHLLLTWTVDLPLLLLFVLAVLRAIDDPSASLGAGVVAGLTASNRLLIVVVAAGLLLGIAGLGPRRVFATRWPWRGAGGGRPGAGRHRLPGDPRPAAARDGDALSASNPADVRWALPLLLPVMLGPPVRWSSAARSTRPGPSSGRARSWVTWTTARAWTTRSRASRSSPAVTRACRGRSCGRACGMSTSAWRVIGPCRAAVAGCRP